MKIYTKTGDKGTTSLFGGQRVDKNSARIRAYGEVDELNSMIGVILADLADYSSSESEGQVEKSEKGNSRPFDKSSTVRLRPNRLRTRTVRVKLLRIQAELFVLGANLATPYDVKVKIPRITKRFVTRLEKEIDKWSKDLPQLRNFILPGGSKVGAKLHLARTVARRAERSIVELADQEKINKNSQIYINRLSDWFFTLARYVNKQSFSANQLESESEHVWQGRSKT